jgi:hypothetical protein
VHASHAIAASGTGRVFVTPSPQVMPHPFAHEATPQVVKVENAWLRPG